MRPIPWSRRTACIRPPVLATTTPTVGSSRTEQAPGGLGFTIECRPELSALDRAPDVIGRSRPHCAFTVEIAEASPASTAVGARTLRWCVRRPGWASIPVAFSNGDGTWPITNGAAPEFIPDWAQPGVRLITGDYR